MPNFYPQSLVATNRSYRSFMRNRRITQHIENDVRIIMEQKVYGTLILRMEFDFFGKHFLINNLPVNWFSTMPNLVVADWFDNGVSEQYSLDFVSATTVYCNGEELLNPHQYFFKSIAEELITRLVRAASVSHNDMWRYKINAEKAAVKWCKTGIVNMQRVNNVSVRDGGSPLFTKTLDTAKICMHNLCQFGLVHMTEDLHQMLNK